jgi:hypothetical protein
MVNTTRFGRKLRLPSTVQLKHQLLLRWLADQEQKESAESEQQMAGAELLHVRKTVTASI